MSLNTKYFDVNASGSKGAVALHTYISSAETLSTIEASGYFDDLATILKTGDLIFITGSDGVVLVKVTDTAGVITVAEVDGNTTFALTALLDGLADAGQTYVVCPFAANLIAAYTTVNTVIATADSVLTLKAPDGTVGTITIALAGVAVGVVDSLTSGLNNTELEAGETVEIENDAGPSAGDATITLIFRRR
jgi:hypothetical protein